MDTLLSYHFYEPDQILEGEEARASPAKEFSRPALIDANASSRAGAGPTLHAPYPCGYI